MVKDIYKPKVKTLTDVWSIISQNPVVYDRERVKTLLEERYKEDHIQPFRGFNANDVYDKELSSLYVIGKYGLGLDQEMPDLFNRIFYIEKNYEEIERVIRKGTPEEAFNLAEKSKDSLARSLRLLFTMVIFSLAEEEELITDLRNLFLSETDEIKHTAKSFARFYTAFKLAESIAEGEIKDKYSFIATKKAIAIRIGIDYPLPREDYVALISSNVFKVKERILNRALGVKVPQRNF
ncbi:DUF2192 domain-containing protein [Sulfuracidifex tepidarius]|uniref:DUF2192 domain-containing protein n=1 Tax=Sulfuracidifex tepidarius TaxID=1294262 RepID=A0A510E4J3_9CREN|nr:DUF2192 domain-containing protein [Sulfuracidifex tepidarius]BBG24608.1 hypothetical protein IC006_1937 [Sulfuracidifex tepidarius]BBG27396.1 hypothetical protein IC007_1945 [Sulfuracidifex tepidarius]